MQQEVERRMRSSLSFETLRLSSSLLGIPFFRARPLFPAEITATVNRDREEKGALM